jgi:serine protease Do
MPSHSGTVRIGFLLIFAASLSAFQPPAPPAPSDALGAFSRSIRALTQKVSPAVVQVLVSGYGAADEAEGQTVALITRQRSTGSGVVVDPDGYIVTNAHVVRGAVRVRVVIAGGRATSLNPDPEAPIDAKIVGVDRGTDLALIKVDRKALTTLDFGDSEGLRQGDIVLAIGSPLGLKNSVSMGVVSASARQISEDNPVAYIQTDASINPGNSGGALVNVEGRLMGINSFIYSQSGGSQGIGFAIPSNIVQNVYKQLRTKGHVHRGEIGVFVQNISPAIAAGLKLPRQTGVLIADVEPGGPAEDAGVKPQDIVLTLDNRRIDYARDFELVFYRRRKGDKVSIGVLRDGKELPKPISVDVAEKESDEEDALADSVKPETNLVPRLGILCIEMDEKMAKLAPDLRQKDGLIVAAKSPDGQGKYIDIEVGDVIHSMNNEPVGSLETFRTVIEGLKPGEPVALLVERNATLRYIGFEIE